MFKKLSKQEVLERLNERKSEIKKLDKLPVSLEKFYLSFLLNNEGIEITPDIEIFGYEEALKENRYIEANFPDIIQVLWIIGRGGQGDEWFIDKENGNILFYDHNKGEYSNIKDFLSLNISFFEFLQMAFLYQELEDLLDEQEEIEEIDQGDFREAIYSIKSDLYDLYPFKYW